MMMRRPVAKNVNRILSLLIVLGFVIAEASCANTPEQPPVSVSTAPESSEAEEVIQEQLPEDGEALLEYYSKKLLNPPLANPDEGFALSGVENVQIIAPLTGEYSINKTSTNYNVYGTDLGIPFEKDDGTIFFAFGDTFSKPSLQGIWRSNVLAYTTDRDASDGILFDGMIHNDATPNAKEILRSKKLDHNEMTVIPTGGVEAADALYMGFMSVRHWGEPGYWDCNNSGLAKSADNGQTWQKLPGPAWDGAGGFAQIHPVKANGYVYFFGIGGGRSTSVSLMRVSEDQIEDKSAYEYVTDMADGAPVYNKGEDAEQRACSIIEAPAGELSVMYSPYLDEWIITYLCDGDLIMRSSKTLEGPYSKPRLIAKQSDYPALYGAFMLPTYTENNGRVIYFMMSLYEPVYNVVIVRAELVKV